MESSLGGRKMLQVASVRRKSDDQLADERPLSGTVVLRYDERHLRRKAISLTNGIRVFIDLPDPVILTAEDQLILDDGSIIEIEAADELLYSVTTSDLDHLIELVWHIGNRHLPAEISQDRILIARDHVIKDMLEGLGATVAEVVMPFNPVRGAYAGHHHDHNHNSQHT